MNLDPARALPAALYREPAWLAAEKERIWRGDWVFASTEADFGHYLNWRLNDVDPPAVHRERTP